jgi:dinuclear metal center YbgI/SA1388 family protein
MSDSRNESAPVARLGLAAIGRRLPGDKVPGSMAERDEILAYLDDLLEIEAFTDYGPNGLQVPGAAEVSRVVTGVSAQLELFERAAASGAELVLTHHGLFWDFHSRTIGPAMKERLRILFDAEISLAGYHLPLDAHPEVGNNALICAALGLDRAEPFAEHKGRPIGFVGRSTEGIAFGELRERCATTFEQEPFVWECGPGLVHSVAVVSGGAPGNFADAIALGVDAFLTGETAEHVMADARENGVHFIAGGHYATERLGIRRIGELVAERFRVEHQFVEIPNPI